MEQAEASGEGCLGRGGLDGCFVLLVLEQKSTTAELPMLQAAVRGRVRARGRMRERVRLKAAARGKKIGYVHQWDRPTRCAVASG